MVLKKKPFLEIIFLIVISAIVYLPNIGRLTYFKDDWYYIYSGLIAGAKIFRPMFSIDRPARGFFFEIYYSLFGPQPLPYHLGAFLWRAVAAIGALYLFSLLWPKDRKFVFFTTLLFVIYPGYFWWISAIEYQPMIASLALQVVSILLTLKSIQSSNRALKIGYLTGAIVTGWIYIALVDYAIGMEVFRFLCVYIFINREHQTYSVVNKFFSALRVWIWNMLIPLGIILWHIFFFNNERKATDVSLQLGVLFKSPVSTLLEWGLHAYNSLLNLGILAWVAQFPRFFFGFHLRDTAYGLGIAATVLVIVFFAEKMLKQPERTVQDVTDRDTTNSRNVEALLLGILGMIFGILPVIMANRYVDIAGFSHYALPASLAASIFLTSFIFTLSLPRFRATILYLVIAFAVLSHYSISLSALNEESAIQEFWWQVSWRVPGLRPGTTLVIHYPSPNIGDDGNGVMEAADVIYFPQPNPQIPVQYKVSAITLSDANVQNVVLGKFYNRVEYRSHTNIFDFGNVLVISQPSSTSCVHVIDGQRPLISTLDPVNVALTAPSSRIENVLADATPFTPQEFVFGSEPDHRWCYYFEKADLALQLSQWDEVVSLGEEALHLGLHPEDQSEWLTFLQAYAVTGNTERLKQTAPKITGDRALRTRACNILTNIHEPLKPEVQDLITAFYCRTSE